MILLLPSQSFVLMIVSMKQTVDVVYADADMPLQEIKSLDGWFWDIKCTQMIRAVAGNPLRSLLVVFLRPVMPTKPSLG